MITEIVKNRNSINYNQISVNASCQSDFDKKGFETLIKDLVKDYINHDYLKNNIYLFLRENGNDDYSYMGKLAYVSHDN